MFADLRAFFTNLWISRIPLCAVQDWVYHLLNDSVQQRTQQIILPLCPALFSRMECLPAADTRSEGRVEGGRMIKYSLA